MPGVPEFEAVETAIKDVIARAAKRGVHTFVSAVFYTPAEVERGSPLLSDMTGRFASYLTATTPSPAIHFDSGAATVAQCGPVDMPVTLRKSRKSHGLASNDR
jgi:hypothetical protein